MINVRLELRPEFVGMQEEGATIYPGELFKSFIRKKLLNWFLKVDLEFNSQRLGLVSVSLESLLCMGHTV